MNISKIRINEQLGWIKDLASRVISLFIRWSSSGINRFSIVLYPDWPTSTVFIKTFLHQTLSPYLYSFSILLPSPLVPLCLHLSELYNTADPLNSCRCFTMIPAPSICARVYRYVPRLCLAPRWIALSLDHVDWGRLIIATFREAISIVTVEDLRDRDKLVRWLSRDNLVNQARHSHTFQSTHKYGCYLLIRTRFALLRSYQLYFLQFTLSPRFSIYTCVYIYIHMYF